MAAPIERRARFPRIRARPRLFDDLLSLTLSIDHMENAATGNCGISRLPAKPFAVTLNPQQNNLGGSWSVDGRHPRPFSRSLNSQGQLELTLNAGRGQAPQLHHQRDRYDFRQPHGNRREL